MHKKIELNQIIRTKGDGRYSPYSVPVMFMTAKFNFYTMPDDGIAHEEPPLWGECNIEFSGSDWDVDEFGLMYTDSCINDISALFNEYTGMKLSWSEKGRQGWYFINLDAEFESVHHFNKFFGV